jgi:hypothetical protein
VVSERDEEFPSNLTSGHNVFAARTLATKPFFSSPPTSSTI